MEHHIYYHVLNLWKRIKNFTLEKEIFTEKVIKLQYETFIIIVLINLYK